MSMFISICIGCSDESTIGALDCRNDREFVLVRDGEVHCDFAYSVYVSVIENEDLLFKRNIAGFPCHEKTYMNQWAVLLSKDESVAAIILFEDEQESIVLDVGNSYHLHFIYDFAKRRSWSHEDWRISKKLSEEYLDLFRREYPNTIFN